MHDLPVDVVHWALAASPVVVLLVLLAVRGWEAAQAGPVGMLMAAGVAVVVFRTPLDTLAAAFGAGVWDAVFVLLVVWAALLLYRTADAAGALVSLRTGIERFSGDQIFLVLALGWVFCSFLQGVAGFGVPVAVVAPLLVAVGVKPVAAVVIALLGHAWANLFGTLGVAWLAMLQVVDVEDPARTALAAAALLWVPNLAAGFTIAYLVGRGHGVRHATPMVLLISAIHGGGQLLLVLASPPLGTFIASAVALLALYPLSRTVRYGEHTDHDDQPAMSDHPREDGAEPVMSFAWSLLPYGILTVAAVAVLAVPPVSRAASALQVGFPLGETTTGYGVRNAAAAPYSPFAPFTHPSFFLLLAAAGAAVAYRAKGFARAWRDRAGPQRVWAGTVADALPASLAIVSFLVLAAILDFSGQVDVLALGIAVVAPAGVFAFTSTFIGVLGAFMTSSSTSANVLFGELQSEVAAEHRLPQPAILAAQGAGGAVGNAIAPSSVVLGTTTAGARGSEGQVLRLTLPWTVAVATVLGVGTVLLT